MKPIFLSLIALLCFACEPENFDIIDDTPDPFEPVVIEVDKPFFLIESTSGPEEFATNGRAVRSAGGGTLTISTAAEGTVECFPNGSIGFTNSTAGLLINAVILPDGSPVLTRVFGFDPNFNPVSEGLLASGFSCQRTDVFEIFDLTDSTITGSINLDLYNITDSTGTTIFPDTCGTLPLVGNYDITFSVPLTRCQ